MHGKTPARMLQEEDEPGEMPTMSRSGWAWKAADLVGASRKEQASLDVAAVRFELEGREGR